MQHSIKMNIKNKREKIQGGILAEGFMIDDVRYVQHIDNGENSVLRALLMGYIYGFNLLNIAI